MADAAFFYLKLRSIQFAVYWGLQVWVLLPLLRLKERRVFFWENREWLRFIAVFMGLQVMVFVPILVVLYFEVLSNFWLSSQFSAALAVFLMALVLFFRPKMLYGIQGLIQYADREATGDSSDTSPSYLDEATVRVLQKKLNVLMNQEKPFLDPNYSLGDLSRDLGIPAYRVTALLNQELDQNFNDFMNRRRIAYLREPRKMSNRLRMLQFRAS